MITDIATRYIYRKINRYNPRPIIQHNFGIGTRTAPAFQHSFVPKEFGWPAGPFKNCSVSVIGAVFGIELQS